MAFAGVGRFSFHGFLAGCRQLPVHRPSSRSNAQQKDQAEDHGKVRARLVHHAQETVTRQVGQRERPKTVSQQRMGILVERMATEMLMSRGMAASRVSKPINTSAPQTISTPPTNGLMICGKRMPILANRPAPKASG